METIQQLAASLKEYKAKKHELEDRLSEVNNEIASLEAHKLPELMEKQEVSKITIDGIGTVYLETRVHASVLAQDKPGFIAWLKENGHGSIVKEDVHNKTLASWAKEMLNQNLPLPEVCKTFKQPVARIRSK